jgi:hypothetical protein
VDLPTGQVDIFDGRFDVLAGIIGVAGLAIAYLGNLVAEAETLT